jgi:hypothetical protein
MAANPVDELEEALSAERARHVSLQAQIDARRAREAEQLKALETPLARAKERLGELEARRAAAKAQLPVLKERVTWLERGLGTWGGVWVRLAVPALTAGGLVACAFAVTMSSMRVPLGAGLASGAIFSVVRWGFRARE